MADAMMGCLLAQLASSGTRTAVSNVVSTAGKRKNGLELQGDQWRSMAGDRPRIPHVVCCGDGRANDSAGDAECVKLQYKGAANGAPTT